jgi:ribose transport system substrate-binding protein
MYLSNVFRPEGRRSLALAASTVVVAAMLAACDGSAASKPEGSAGPTSAGAAASAKKADAFIKPYLSSPTEIPLKDPLKAAPTPGKTIVFLQCELAQCKSIGDGVVASATLVGWEPKVIPYQSSNPSTLAGALHEALRYDPVATTFTSMPYALWSQAVAEYKAAGVPLIPSFTGEVPLDDTIIANPASPEYAELNGTLLANWVIADSKANGTVLSVTTPDFPYLDDVSKAFDSTIASGCPDCKVTEVKLGIPDIASGASSNIIVSALRKDPTIKYVISANSGFIAGLPSALNAAGLGGKVKIGGCCGTNVTETGLASGQFSAVTGVNLAYGGYISVDAALRYAEGSPIPATEGTLPIGLLVEGTDTAPSDSYAEPSDFVQQFKTLWKVG